MRQLRGKRVLVMGLGGFGGGAGVARFCAGEGAEVTVTDLRAEKELGGSLAELAGLPIRYHLGGHDESDFTSADLVVVNPAVDPLNNRYLQAAERAGVGMATEIGLLVERLDRSRVIGVTGTAGKSTTVAMIGHILAHALGPDRVHIGGNIGGSLLNRLHAIRPDHWVVLELSSFMLETLGRWSPHIAIVTNLAGNHLDRHGTFEAYAAAKQNILEYQGPEDVAVLGHELPENIRPRTRHYTVQPPAGGFPRLSLPGEHNRLNAAFALRAAQCVGVEFADLDEAERVLREFPGLPHRLQLVLEHAGVRFYNDSKSTTPESAMLAIDAFPPGNAHVLLGGYDKKADLGPLARHAAARCAAIYTVGGTGDAIANEAGAQPNACPVHRCGTLDAAVERAARQAGNGQVVLLSPGCASWDQFPNYEARGRLFAELALRYTSGE